MNETSHIAPATYAIKRDMFNNTFEIHTRKNIQKLNLKRSLLFLDQAFASALFSRSDCIKLPQWLEAVF